MRDIKITIEPATSFLESNVLDKAASDAVSDACSYEVIGHEHMRPKPYWKNKGHWDGRKRLYHRSRRTFPTGLLSRIVDVLKEHGYNPVYIRTNAGVRTARYPDISDEWALRPYQTCALGDALTHKCGMLKIATGGGKTVIAGHLIQQAGTPAVFLVHTKDLLYQAKGTFEDMFGEQWVGQIGDGVIDPRINGVTVCTIQTAARALDVKYMKHYNAEYEDSWLDQTLSMSDTQKFAIADTLRMAGMVIMDECHRVAAQTAMDVMYNVTHAQYRIGLSASPWRDDGADIALEAAFGPTLTEINASQLIDMGFLVPPVIRFVQGPGYFYNKQWKYSSVYQDYIVDNERRNQLIVDNALRMIKQGMPTMILVQRIEHGHKLHMMIHDQVPDTVFLSGQCITEVRNGTLAAMRSGNLKCLIATTIADEGLDLKPLSGLVLAGGGKSSVRALQRIGRALRTYPGKQHAEIVDFVDNAKFLINHSEARRAIYESEPRFTVIG